MDNFTVLKAIADANRIKIITLLLRQSYCVGALAKKLNISDAAVSQHLKVLREAGIISGEKKGYITHYSVDRSLLRQLAKEIDNIAGIEQKLCEIEENNCHSSHVEGCRCNGGGCSERTRELCHGAHHKEEGEQK